MHRSFVTQLLVSMCILLCTAGAASAQQANAILKRADDLRKAGQYDRAIAEASEAIRLNGKNAVSYWVRGAAYVGKGDYDPGTHTVAVHVTMIPG